MSQLLFSLSRSLQRKIVARNSDFLVVLLRATQRRYINKTQAITVADRDVFWVTLDLFVEDFELQLGCGQTGNFSLHYRVQNGPGAHPASFPMGAGDSFPVVEAAGA
jgi:hypothetical protein